MEFKEGRSALPSDFFETVCAFLNREGGAILLGVRNDGSVAGVEPAAVDRLIADIVNLSNPRVDPPFILCPQRWWQATCSGSAVPVRGASLQWHRVRQATGTPRHEPGDGRDFYTN